MEKRKFFLMSLQLLMVPNKQKSFEKNNNHFALPKDQEAGDKVERRTERNKKHECNVFHYW